MNISCQNETFSETFKDGSEEIKCVKKCKDNQHKIEAAGKQTNVTSN